MFASLFTISLFVVPMVAVAGLGLAFDWWGDDDDEETAFAEDDEPMGNGDLLDDDVEDDAPNDDPDDAPDDNGEDDTPDNDGEDHTPDDDGEDDIPDDDADGEDTADPVFHVAEHQYSGSSDFQPLEITDFRPGVDTLVLEGFDTYFEIHPLENQDGVGLFDDRGALQVVFPGLETLSPSDLRYDLEEDDWEYPDRYLGEDTPEFFDVQGPEDGETDILVSADTEYGFWMGDEADNRIEVHADTAIVNGGAGDDTILIDGAQGGSEDSGVELYEDGSFLPTGLNGNGFWDASIVWGGPGNDTIQLDGGDAIIWARNDGEADTIHINGGGTVLVSAGDGDHVIAHDRPDSLFVSISGDADGLGSEFTGGDFTDVVRAYGDNVVVNGNGGNDDLSGGFGAQIINGGEGDDRLIGKYFDDQGANHGSSFEWFADDDPDILNGGAGDDYVQMSTGDIATGGDGTDEFVVYHDPEGEVTRITDFVPGSETVEVILDGGVEIEVLEEVLIRHPSYVLDDKIDVTETEEGDTQILLEGEVILQLDGATGLNVGYQRWILPDEPAFPADLRPDTETVDLDGNIVDPGDLDIVLSKFVNRSDAS